MADKFYDYYNYPSWITENWHKFYDLAESYKSSIKVLLQNEANFQERIYSERDIIPIIFLFRHYLELVLKSFLLKNGQRKFKGHNIKSLLNKVKNINSNFKLSKENLKFISEMSVLDNTGYWFRYPTDNNLKEKFVTNNQKVSKGVSLSDITINFNRIFTEIEKLIKI